MSRHRRVRRPPGAGWRVVRALAVLVVVVAGVPALLTVCAWAGLEAWHPLPGIGSWEEITGFFERQLSPTEVAPIAMRVLLVAAWLLWAAMVTSIAAAIVDARGSRRWRLPQFAMFAGLARWVAAGLTALTSTASGYVGAAALESPRPYTISTPVTTPAPIVEAPIPAGHGRVQRGESIETFAQRTLGAGARWVEIWELNQHRPVGRDGERWVQPWRIEPGWDLRLPATTPPATTPSPAAAVGRRLAEVIDADRQVPDRDPALQTRVVAPGDSYWSIAEASLGPAATGFEVNGYMEALIEHNAARLGHGEATMLHPGDVVELPPPPPSSSTPGPLAAEVDSDDAAAGHVAHVVVEPGDSYWSIAEANLGSTATEGEVLELTGDLIALNNPILAAGDPDGSRNYDDDPRMIHPGDVVYLADPATAATPPPPPPPVRPLPPPAAPARPVPPTAERPDETGADAEVAAEGVSTIPPTKREPAPQALPPPVADRSEVDDGGPSSVLAVVPGGLAGLTTLAAAGAAAMFALRRRRASRGGRRQRPASLPAELHATAAELASRDVSDVAWLTGELRWLAHNCPPEQRATLVVELVQVAEGGRLEVAFRDTPSGEPPIDWVVESERVWRLERPHPNAELAAYDEYPPTVPALVTLGDVDAGSQLYLNVEACAGINLTGDPAAMNAWVTNLVWEVAGEAVVEHASVLAVDVAIPGVEHLDNVTVTTAAAALAQFRDPTLEGSRPMFDRRVNRLEGYDPTIVVLGSGVDGAEWEAVAARLDVAVIALEGSLPDGLDVIAGDGTLTVPAWDLTVNAAALTGDTVETVTDLLTAAEHPPVPDELVIDPPPPDLDPAVEPTGEAGELWVPPGWPVTVHVLGVPSLSVDGTPVPVTPQQLSILACLALRRQIAQSDLCAAIWGTGEVVPDHRVRGVLSNLRVTLEGYDVVRKVDDGVVRAGDDLGADTMLFEALNERARQVPGEWMLRRHEMIELATGRPFAYPASVEQHWRWADLDLQHATWQHRIVTAACELADVYLDHGDAHSAMLVANQGLRVDPTSAAVVETLIRAYAACGELASARRVLESHDRALAELDLGGASEETRQLFDRLCTGHGDDGGDDVAIAS